MKWEETIKVTFKDNLMKQKINQKENETDFCWMSFIKSQFTAESPTKYWDHVLQYKYYSHVQVQHNMKNSKSTAVL